MILRYQTYQKSLEQKYLLLGLKCYQIFIKYGFWRATQDAAHEIRDGHITSEEGQSLYKQYDEDFPSKSYELFKNYIGISDKEFNLFINKYRSPYVWYKFRD